MFLFAEHLSQRMTRSVRTFSLEALQSGWQVQERQGIPSGVQIEHCLGSGVFSSFLQPISLQGRGKQHLLQPGRFLPHYKKLELKPLHCADSFESWPVHFNDNENQRYPQPQTAVRDYKGLCSLPMGASSPLMQNQAPGIYGTEQSGEWKTFAKCMSGLTSCLAMDHSVASLICSIETHASLVHHVAVLNLVP